MSNVDPGGHAVDEGEQFNSSDTDDESEYHALKTQHYVEPSAWYTSLWSFSSTPCLHITRRKKLALLLAIVLTVILFLAASYSFGLDRSLVRLKPSWTSLPNWNGSDTNSKDPPSNTKDPSSNATDISSDPPPAEPTICSSWPSTGASTESRVHEAREHAKARGSDGRPKWTKPRGFNITAVVFCKLPVPKRVKHVLDSADTIFKTDAGEMSTSSTAIYSGTSRAMEASWTPYNS